VWVFVDPGSSEPLYSLVFFAVLHLLLYFCLLLTRVSTPALCGAVHCPVVVVVVAGFGSFLLSGYLFLKFFVFLPFRRCFVISRCFKVFCVFPPLPPRLGFYFSNRLPCLRKPKGIATGKGSSAFEGLFLLCFCLF
jgi:hypothetical protein